MDEVPDNPGRTECPICGEAAEVGCLYGKDGWFGLQWLVGEPGFLGNLSTGMGGGEPVGERGIFAGPYARGVRCKRCQRIILET